MSQLRNTTRNDLLMASDLIKAHTFLGRGLGLLGKKELNPNSALWLKPCNNVHTLFMKFALDIIFVDKNLVVTEIHRNVRPWKPLLVSWKSHSAFEFSAGALHTKEVQIGDQLHVSD
ncbi:MAG: DUF192 domain-containing protein [Bdellovibrionales bacterium]|nr:DUF192 domain-containing protein [Bdellovibrionales bacterium]